MEEGNAKHGKQVGAHLDGLDDIYDHTASMFTKDGPT